LRPLDLALVLARVPVLAQLLQLQVLGPAQVVPG